MWFRKKNPEGTTQRSEGAVRKYSRLSPTRIIKWTLSTTIKIAIGVLLAAIFFLWGSKYYTMYYLVLPGEKVTVESINRDNVRTNWHGRSYPYPTFVVRKDNGWRREFSFQLADQNIAIGDTLIRAKDGTFAYAGKPLPRMTSAKTSGVGAVPYEDTDMSQFIPADVPPSASPAKIKRAETAKIKHRLTPDNVACSR